MFSARCSVQENKAMSVHVPLYSNTYSVHSYSLLGMPLSMMEFAVFVLTMVSIVDELPDNLYNEISDKLAEFGKCQEGEAEPQTKHSTEVRYVLYRLHTL